MAEAKYRVGIIGGGRMGTHHGRAYALHPMIEVVAVADTDEENRQLFAQRFGARPYVDYEEMLAVEKPDITGAILPVKEHADAVVAAAAAGVRAVFCEKPMTALLADADRMVAACQERGAIFAAGVVPRNYPEYCPPLGASGNLLAMPYNEFPRAKEVMNGFNHLFGEIAITQDFTQSLKCDVFMVINYKDTALKIENDCIRHIQYLF